MKKNLFFILFSLFYVVGATAQCLQIDANNIPTFVLPTEVCSGSEQLICLTVLNANGADIAPDFAIDNPNVNVSIAITQPSATEICIGVTPSNMTCDPQVAVVTINNITCASGELVEACLNPNFCLDAAGLGFFPIALDPITVYPVPEEVVVDPVCGTAGSATLTAEDGTVCATEDSAVAGMNNVCPDMTDVDAELVYDFTAFSDPIGCFVGTMDNITVNCAVTCAACPSYVATTVSATEVCDGDMVTVCVTFDAAADDVTVNGVGPAVAGDTQICYDVTAANMGCQPLEQMDTPDVVCTLDQMPVAGVMAAMFTTFPNAGFTVTTNDDGATCGTPQIEVFSADNTSCGTVDGTACAADGDMETLDGATLLTAAPAALACQLPDLTATVTCMGCVLPAGACDAPAVVACGDVVTGDTSTDGVIDPTLVGQDCGLALTSETVVFEFLGTGDEVTVDLGGSGFDTQLNVYEGTCGDGASCVGSDDDSSPSGGFTSLFTFISTPGSTYYFAIDGFGTANGAFSMEVTCVPPPANPCDTPIAIACGDVLTGVSTDGSDFSGNADCGLPLGGSPAIAFEFIGTGDDVTFDLGGSGFDTQINVYQGTCGDAASCVGSDDDSSPAGGFTSLLLVPATVLGDTYYVILDGFGAASGDYSIEAVCPVPPMFDFVIIDPCSCNADETYTVGGTTAAPDGVGTFSEVIEVMGPAGFVITTDAASTGGAASLTFVESPAGVYTSPMFNHTTNTGYTANLFGEDPVNNPGVVFPIGSISNVCTYPSFSLIADTYIVDVCSDGSIVPPPAATVPVVATSTSPITSQVNTPDPFDPNQGAGVYSVTYTVSTGDDGNAGISPDGGTTPAIPGCDITFMQDITVTENDVCAPISDIPTLSEWGLMTLALLLMTLGAVKMAVGSVALAGVGTKNVPMPFNASFKLPFNMAILRKAFHITAILSLIGFAICFAMYGGIFLPDMIGVAIAGPIFAYLAHLLYILETNNK